MTHNPNIIWHPAAISKSDRQSLNGHKSCVLWFTGLSGSGKSVLANAVDEKLYRKGIQSYVLDGDNIRHGLNKDLGFQTGDRIENIRRIGEVAKLFVDSGQMILTAFISPFREDRDMVRALFPKGEFFEIYVKCPLHVCEQRDPKGLYKKRETERSNISPGSILRMKRRFHPISSLSLTRPLFPMELISSLTHCKTEELYKNPINVGFFL